MLNLQIPLGVKLENEMKYEEMIDIMLDLHCYVPRHAKCLLAMSTKQKKQSSFIHWH